MDITGTTAAERLTGTASADTLDGLGGADTLDGAGGSDTVSYANAIYSGNLNDVVVDLAAGTGTFIQHSIRGIPVTTTVDTLISIENVIGSSGGDVLKGDAGGNRIDGGDGGDSLDGRAGNDALYGGLGDDSLRGGAGSDTIDGGVGEYDSLSFEEFGSQRVVVDLSVNRAWSGADTDVVSGIEWVTGTAGDDWMQGDASVNTLIGGSGGDVIRAFGATGDTLIGGDGNDALYGAGGNDTIISNKGVDYVEGGAGNDTIYEESDVVGEWSALYGNVGNDEIVIHGRGSTGVWGGDGNDTIDLSMAGTVYATGGAGADTYVMRNIISLTQIYDFAQGQDKIRVESSSPTTSPVTVLDWGVNTGVQLTDTSTGAVSTIMLMGIDSETVVMSRDFILT